MGKSWRSKYVEKHGYEWGQGPKQEVEHRDYGQNVIEPCGTWKNPNYLGVHHFEEYGNCDVYFATRIETEESELIIVGWKTPESERVTVPICFEENGKKVFTGIYKTFGEMENKRVIPVGKQSCESVLAIFREIRGTNLERHQQFEQLIERVACR